MKEVIRRGKLKAHAPTTDYCRIVFHQSTWEDYTSNVSRRSSRLRHTANIKRGVATWGQRTAHFKPKGEEWVIMDNNAEMEPVITEMEFGNLAKNWKKQTAHFSTMYHKLNNQNYLKIIGSGYPVVRYILKDLQKTSELWHEALYFITKDNPVNPADMNDI